MFNDRTERRNYERADDEEKKFQNGKENRGRKLSERGYMKNRSIAMYNDTYGRLKEIRNNRNKETDRVFTMDDTINEILGAGNQYFAIQISPELHDKFEYYKKVTGQSTEQAMEQFIAIGEAMANTSVFEEKRKKIY